MRAFAFAGRGAHLQRELCRHHGRQASRDHFKFTFATASSGNHGRSVAAGARLFGNPCFVFLPKFTSAEKEAAIRARGAQVIRVDGDYDAAVAECRRKSEANGWTIISDTSWEGYDSVPRTSCAATACWRTRRSCSNGRRGQRMCSSRPASAGLPPR